MLFTFWTFVFLRATQIAVASHRRVVGGLGRDSNRGVDDRIRGTDKALGTFALLHSRSMVCGRVICSIRAADLTGRLVLCTYRSREYIILATLDQGALKGSKIRMTTRIHCFGVPLRRHFRARRFLRRATSPPHASDQPLGSCKSSAVGINGGTHVAAQLCRAARSGR